MNEQIYYNFIVEPIKGMDECLIGVELLTRFFIDDLPYQRTNISDFIASLGIELKQELLINQLNQVKLKKDFFIQNDIVCCINVDFDFACMIVSNDHIKNYLYELNFIIFEISEHFPNIEDGKKNPLLQKLCSKYKLWLDDLGTGGATLEVCKTGIFDCIKIDKNFFWSRSTSLMWPVIINNIKKYCNKIIIEGVENREHLAACADVYGTQGYLYRSVKLDKIESLIEI
ncbi:EAL domain-containing protein [Hafnia paralvei]|uniref:EAL domain-containing protein n=1 Tax=Hafnia paralvei TaxID=546367 RepID=UPI001C03B98E|nr:EAL domain-containing protein [Hafnia paralvei]MBU2672437.1 EAL domain-containing protein [Hafnia paralvei]